MSHGVENPTVFVDVMHFGGTASKTPIFLRIGIGVHRSVHHGCNHTEDGFFWYEILGVVMTYK